MTQFAVCIFTFVQYVAIVQLVSGFLFRGHCFSVPVDLAYLEKEVSLGASFITILDLNLGLGNAEGITEGPGSCKVLQPCVHGSHIQS